MIDWNSVWKLALLASRDGRLENGYEKEEAAERYDRSEIARQDGERRAAALEVEPSWSVLDIGAGPGTLALPLSRRARQVTAVEPSSAMVKRLEKHIAEAGISNIRILPKRWEDLSDEEVGEHDLVIASYSLSFLDMQEALLKMDRLAKRQVILFWFAGVPSWEKIRAELYPRIYGREHVCHPMSDVLYNLLYSLGIYASVKVLEGTEFPRTYESMDDGVSEMRRALGLGTQEHDETIRAYLERRGRRDGERVVLEDDTVYVRISWRNAG
ncbi:MAG: Mg-protoporphyrin IX methyl transferase [Methanosaeta sp. PtaB.Bin039]|nr:MAG: Mg-protoporphyrin IX methyl transferase [Methanosaeta sp. PtaB.Bin039]